jgi:glycosyltransferase 2 family protein
LNPQGLFGPLLGQNGELMTRKRSRWVGLLALLLAVFFLYLALRNLDWQTFLEIFGHTQYAYLPLILVWGSLVYWVRAIRWRTLLEAGGELPVVEIFWANMAGYLGNTLLPARAGELIRAGYLAAQSKLHAPFVLATGLVERLVDMVALIILGSFSLASLETLPASFRLGLVVLAAVAGIGLGVVFFLPRMGRIFEKLIGAVPRISESSKSKLLSIVQQFLDGFRSLANGSRAIRFIFLTALIWLMDSSGTVLIAYALGLPLKITQAVVLLAGLGLSSAIPSTPGYVGVYQYVAVIILAPFGYSSAQAVALILFSQIANLLIVLTWGGLALWRFSRRLLSQ